jgi:PAS domain S-box-containing protein
MDSVPADLTGRGRPERAFPVAARFDFEQLIREMQGNHTLMQMLLDQVPEGVTIAYGPPDFPNVATSRQAEQLMGVSRHDLLGIQSVEPRHSHGLFLDDGITRPRPDQIPLYRASRFGETIRNEEFVVARPDGTQINVLVNTNPIKTPEGRILGAITSWRDITEIKRAQAALRVSEAQLRDADLRKDQFLGMVAHELRGPLSPIRNAVHILQIKSPGDSVLQDICHILDRQVTTITRLLDDLLDLSRVARGKLDLKMAILDLVSVVEEAVEWNRALIDAKGHQLTVVHPSEPVLVKADAVRLAHVISNLLGNAAKYTDSGGRIELTIEPAEAEVVIRVSDTGRGLEASELENIFDLFYQLERTSDRAERGLGIGLSLVRSLVEMHGGRVEVSGEGLGRGSEFSFCLPLLSTLRGSGRDSETTAEKTRESMLDSAFEATFPASDPLSITQPGGGQSPSTTTMNRCLRPLSSLGHG